MLEQVACCILGVCCEAAAAQTALAGDLVAQTGLTPAQAAPVAAYIMGHYDLAPSGTLGPFTRAIVAHLTAHLAAHPPTA